MKKLYLLFLFISFSLVVSAQGELIEEEDEIFYENERTYAVTVRTNGWGVDYRYGRRIDGYRKRLFSFEFATLKHPRELRISNFYGLSNDRFVYGKLNNIYTLKGSYGFQKEMYGKRDKNGLSIRYFYLLGATVSIIKPIYYEINYNTYIKTERFNYNLHQPYNIVGTASFLKGINEIKFSPGVFAKYGYSFEFGKKIDRVNALDLGLMIEGYLLPIKILGVDDSNRNLIDDNNHLFFALFFSYRFGKIIDAYE